MLTTILAAAAPKENPYGLIPALREGGLISQTVFGILVLMLFFSLYILFTKLFEQQKILNQAKRVDASVAEEANKMIAAYSTHTPAVQDLFMIGKKEGDKIHVGGLINETTTIR